MTALGRQIGAGGSSEVFTFGSDAVVKLFRPEFAYAADLEERATRAVHGRGLRTPEVRGRIELDGRPGLLLERIDGPLWFETLADPARDAEGSERLASLHVELHGLRAPELPNLRELARPRPGRSAAELRAHGARVALVPEGESILHGDFHVGNVIGSEPPAVIDWVNACTGPPACDVARSIVLIAYQGLRGPDSPKRRAYAERRRTLAERYRRAYEARSGIDAEQIDRCLPLVAQGVLAQEPDNLARAELERLAAVRA